MVIRIPGLHLHIELWGVEGVAWTRVTATTDAICAVQIPKYKEEKKEKKRPEQDSCRATETASG